jgi:hypothetical protein
MVGARTIAGRTLDGFRYFKTKFFVESDCFCVGHLRVDGRRRQSQVGPTITRMQALQKQATRHLNVQIYLAERRVCIDGV